jgi:hypothetical protein
LSGSSGKEPEKIAFGAGLHTRQALPPFRPGQKYFVYMFDYQYFKNKKWPQCSTKVISRNG